METPASPRRKRRIVANLALAIALIMLGVVAMLSCARPDPLPSADGTVTEIRRSDSEILPGEAGYETTLQVKWFGSACHEIRLGELSVVTDPFVTTGPFIQPGPDQRMESDPDVVKSTLGKLRPPDAVVVNHGHHDHLLDAREALGLENWKDVPLYGGRTCLNILAGWGDAALDARCHDSLELLRTPVPVNGLRIRSFRGRHAPHLACGSWRETLLDGKVDSPCTRPPAFITDYKAGEVYNYLVGFPHGGRVVRVFLLGGPLDADSLPAGPVDVVFLCSPGGGKVDPEFRFPAAHLEKLDPRHIVINHFDNLTAEPGSQGREQQAALLGRDLAQLPWIVRQCQLHAASHPRLEKIHVPALTKFDPSSRARNVIRIPAGR